MTNSTEQPLRIFVSELFEPQLNKIYFWRTFVFVAAGYAFFAAIGALLGFLAGNIITGILIGFIVNSFFLVLNGDRVDEENDRQVKHSLYAIYRIMNSLKPHQLDQAKAELLLRKSQKKQLLSIDNAGTLTLLLDFDD